MLNQIRNSYYYYKEYPGDQGSTSLASTHLKFSCFFFFKSYHPLVECSFQKLNSLSLDLGLNLLRFGGLGLGCSGVLLRKGVLDLALDVELSLGVSNYTNGG